MKIRGLVYVIHQEMVKIVTGKIFWIISILSCVMLGFETIFTDLEGREISAFYALFCMNLQDRMENMEFSSVRVMLHACNGYFIIFAPLLVGLIMLPSLCDERESGVFRYKIFRTDRKNIVVGKLISSMLCGGLALALGYGLFCLFCKATFPDLVDYQLGMVPQWGEVVRSILGIGGYGAVSAIWVYLFSMFFENKYLATCVPYLLLDFIRQKCQGLILEGKESSSMLVWVRDMVLPHNMQKIGIKYSETLCILGWNLVLFFVVAILHWCVLCRRVDCGK